MISPLDLATSGHLDSPLSVATSGHLSFSTVAPPDTQLPVDGGGAGGGAPYSRGRHFRWQERERLKRLRQGDEDFVFLMVEAVKFLLGK